MAYLEGKAGEIEKQVAEDEDEAVMKPGDEGYFEFRQRLIEAAETHEEMEAIYERYPYWTPAHREFENQQRSYEEANAERNAAIEAAQSDEELREAYEKHPKRLSHEDQRLEEYRQAVAEAETPEEMDAVYERFGRAVPDRSGVGY